MSLKRFFIGLVAATLVACPTLGTAASEKPIAANEDIALVNGKPIKSKDYLINLNRMKMIYQQRGGQVNDAVVDDMKKRALNGVISEELLRQESQKAGIKVDKNEVNEQLSEFRGKFATEEAYQEKLKEMGITETILKTQIERGLAIQGLVDKRIIDKVNITETETRDFYDKNPQFFVRPESIRASHILIKVEDGADEVKKMAARKKIAEIKKRLGNGEDFGALAREYSEGPSATKGGDLGYFQKGQMVPPFEKAAFALEMDQVSDMVLTNFGYHLIKLTGRKPAETVSYTEAAEQISTRLKQQRVNEAVSGYIEELKSKADIKML